MGQRVERRIAGWVALCLLIAAAALVLLEGLFRLWPTALPRWYRATLPMRGIDLLYPGILERTPIEGVPVPYRFDRKAEYRGGGPPRELEAAGLVPREQNPDWETYPELYRRADRNGFLNPSERDHADLLLVGDSYTYAMGVLSPPGLQGELERTTGLVLFNLGVPAIGPQREEWLLEHFGLPLEPKAVVWFFYGGNDLEDAAMVDRHRRRGVTSYADLFTDRPRPRSLVIDLVAVAAGRGDGPATSSRGPLPPFRLSTPDGERPVWFSPHFLRQQVRSRETLERSVGWRVTREVLTRVADRSAERGISLLVVYVPSKPEVMHDLIVPDPELLLQVANYGRLEPFAASPQELAAVLAANVGHLDDMLGGFCASLGIDFLSLTGALRDATRRGALVYMSADTHWNEQGQRTALEPLTAWLKAQGVIADEVADGARGGRRLALAPPSSERP